MNAEALTADVWRIIDKANLDQNEYIEFLMELQDDAQVRIDATQQDIYNDINEL